MIVGVPKETFPGERRVALIPASIPTLAKAGCEVLVEAGAGETAVLRAAESLPRMFPMLTTACARCCRAAGARRRGPWSGSSSSAQATEPDPARGLVQLGS